MIKIKRGLVLEGGGAKGSYHIGAYKAVKEKGINIDGITGTSIGSLNGAMIVQGDLEMCEKLWKNLSYDQVIDLGGKPIEDLEKLSLNMDNILNIGDQLKKIVRNKGFDISPFKATINKYIDEERVRESDLDFGLVTVNVTDMEPLELFKEDIPIGQLKQMLLASSYLPSFKQEKIKGKTYIDGAFYDNLPFSMLQKKGYEEFILIRTEGIGLIKRKEMEKLNAIIISPSEDLGRTYDFSRERAIRNLNLGYYDAMKVLDNLRGSIYTIDKSMTEEDYFNFIIDLDDSKIDEMMAMFKISELPRRRAMFEKILPKLAEALKLEKDYNYSDILIGLLEKQAWNLGIDQFAIYGFKELHEIVRDKHIPIKYEEIGTIEYLLERVDLSTVFNMDKILLKVGEIIFRDEADRLEENIG